MANKKKQTVEEETVKEKKNKVTKNDVRKKEIVKEETKKKEEKVEEKPAIESPIKSGMSETTRGMIIGMIIMGLIATIIILLILGKNDGKTSNNGSSSNSNSNTYSNSNSGSNTQTLTPDYEAYKKLTATDKKKGSEEAQKFYKYFDKENPTLIVFARETCGFCEIQKPIVERIGKMYDLDYLFMNTDKLTSEEIYNIISYLGIEGSTPVSIIVQKGKVIDSVEGLVDSGKEYVNFLVSGGVLPKGSTYKDEDQLTSVTYSKFKELLNGKELSVVLFDFYYYNKSYCGERCLDERAILNKIAKEENIKVYHLPITAIEDSFSDDLGKWGYSTDAYKENKSVSIPLLMFVRNGKLEWYQNGTGTMTEDEIRKEMKDYKIIK